MSSPAASSTQWSTTTSSTARRSRSPRRRRCVTTAEPERVLGEGRAERADEDALFREFRATRSRRLRNELVERHRALAAHVPRRFGRRGPSDDDLRQVAFLALVKAVDRFEPDRNMAFSTIPGGTMGGGPKSQ